jgi:signal transduction histidine kinase
MARASDHGGGDGEPLRVTDDGLVEINRWWTVARIVSNASHDLNNALQIISGNIEMLRAKADLDSVTARRAESIATQAERAAATIDRLVSYARDEQGVPQRIDMRVLAGNAIALRTVTLSRRRIAATLTASDENPYWAAVDPQAAMQLLLNLLLAAERDLSGQPTATIDVRLSRGARTIEIEVCEQASAWAARPQSDTPLGFTVSVRAADRLAARVGGRLAVEAEAAGGHRASLSLPSSES